MEFEFINQAGSAYDNYEPLFQTLLKQALVYLKRPLDVVLETSLVDDATIQTLNRDYRGIDRPTDVLSFAFLDEVAGEPSIKGVPFTDLGAIVISVEKAASQATEYGHSIERELSFLFIHGLLHLCGYDHQNDEDETIMIATQDAILGKRKPNEKR